MKCLYSDMKLTVLSQRKVEKSIARQRLVKQVSAATNTHAKAEKLLGVNFNNRLVKICFPSREYKQMNKCIVGWGASIRSA
jgi:hypothetical protein